MLRLCAAWLVLLVVLPFSAPFSTCDGAALGGHGVAGTAASICGSDVAPNALERRWNAEPPTPGSVSRWKRLLMEPAGNVSALALATGGGVGQTGVGTAWVVPLRI